MAMMIKINCDMGEGFGIWTMGQDEQIMPYISMANLACGFHASDAMTMSKSVALAKKHDVIIGAHPSYQDLIGFGRRSIVSTAEEIRAIVLYQLGALDAFCKACNTTVSYLKPHGALYNDMMRDKAIFEAILSAVAAYDKEIKLMTLATPNHQTYAHIAKSYNIDLIGEVFADRNYKDDGTLVKRSEKNAFVSTISGVIKRVQLLKEEGFIQSINDTKLFLKADTICVHSDGEQALYFIEALHKVLHS